MNEINDYKLQSFLQKAIGCDDDLKQLAKSIYMCGKGLLPVKAEKKAAFLLSDGHTSKFFGLTTCKNPWACPVCERKVMAKHALETAAALDILEKEHNQVAFMLTLTVPHTSGMSLKETAWILREAWSQFIIHGNKAVRNYKNDPFANFCSACNCEYRIRVMEVTWGQHGWHPHFHCLFWVDKNKLNVVEQYEQKLKNRWFILVKRATLKYWNKIYDDKLKNSIRLEIMYSKLDPDAHAFHISKDDNNKIIIQKSSSYICGWGADKEINGNYKDKASHEGHYTPRQLLESAYNGNNHHLKLYLEFVREIRELKMRRFQKSLGGDSTLHQLINFKFFELSKKTSTFKVVYSFDEDTWYEICDNKKNLIKFHLLELATLPNAKDLIEFYLSLYSIYVKRNVHPLEELIENLFSTYDDCTLEQRILQ